MSPNNWIEASSVTSAQGDFKGKLSAKFKLAEEKDIGAD